MGSRLLNPSLGRLQRSLAENFTAHWVRSACCCYSQRSTQSTFANPQRRATQRRQHTQRRVSRVNRAVPQPIDISEKHEQIRALQRVDELVDDALKVLDFPHPPDELEILDSLRTYEKLALYLSTITEPPIATQEVKATPAMDLLFLDENDETSRASAKSTAVLATAVREEAVEKLSFAAYKIVKSLKVFLTPKLLETYVDVQSLLARPETLSQVFILYAHKPIPKLGTSPIQYTAVRPSSLASAIPLKIANRALTAAIEAKNLPLCLDIISSTVCAAPFRRSKVFKKAVIPILGFSLAPLAAYTLASQISVYQDTMTPEMATNVAFAGILAYVGLTGTIGVVALTTANDQMDRVTWATGTPLRERWLREEERAMIDRVAGAWGFKETWRRGEEEGQDWVALREFTGLRGMVLDRVELMEGME
ncbi:hypothetical protein MMC19_001116 [Ptychographa xylographoides]|nr:hypothetical protein [Ptychographa xylographoides]